jgi:DhnA family fructose-bisphosphate aldolase class Ia
LAILYRKIVTALDPPMFDKGRMHRLFRADGRSLIVAMDHVLGAKAYPGLQAPDAVVKACVAGGADAVLTTPGVLKRFGSCFGAVGIVLRVDGRSTELSSEKRGPTLLYSVEDALRLGADAVACMGYPGTTWEADSLANIATLAAHGQAWNVPVMAEMIPGGFADVAAHTVDNIRFAVRVGIEWGADFIKTKYTGSEATFRDVTQHAYRPVLVLGGGKVDDLRALLSSVKGAIDGGARGAVIGRNVWGHPRPRDIVCALARIIHDGASIEQAVAGLDPS